MGLERINDFKKEAGITNEELAALSNVPKSTIDKITAGKTYDPKLETVKAIVKALGKTLDDLDDISQTNSANSSTSAPVKQRSTHALEVADAYDALQTDTEKNMIRRSLGLDELKKGIPGANNGEKSQAG